jgi:hypothetical protein
MQGHVAIAAPAGGGGDAQLFAQTRMFRIKQTNSLDFSTALPTSPRRYPHSATPHFFHEIPRAAGPPQQTTKCDGPPHINVRFPALARWATFCHP